MSNSYIPATQVSPGDGSGTPSATGLGLVENTALSTWTGSTSITTLGVVTVGSFPAANLTGGTLAANVLASSLTSVGTLSSLTMGGQILSPIAVTAGTPNFSFVGDADTGVYHAAADAIGFATAGVGRGLVNQLGQWFLGQITDNGTGSPLQVTGGTATGIECTGYGGTGNVYMRLAAGTAASPTATTTAQIARIGLRGIDTAGSTTYSLGGNLEITPGITWTASDHSTSVALYYTPTGSTTRTKAFDIPYTTGDVSASVGHVRIETAGKGLGIKSGVNCRMGTTGNLVAGSAVVANTAVAAGDVIQLVVKTPGGTLGVAAYVSAISAGTSFTVTSVATDTSDYYFIIFRPL